MNKTPYKEFWVIYNYDIVLKQLEMEEIYMEEYEEKKSEVSNDEKEVCEFTAKGITEWLVPYITSIEYLIKLRDIHQRKVTLYNNLIMDDVKDLVTFKEENK